MSVHENAGKDPAVIRGIERVTGEIYNPADGTWATLGDLTPSRVPGGAHLPGWRTMALAAISEGFCPDHTAPLDPQPRGGWCGICHVWWRTKESTVIADYLAEA